MLSLPLTPVQDAAAADANAAAASAAASAADASADTAERTPFHGQAHNSRATFPPSRGFPESPNVAVHHRAAPNAHNAHNAYNVHIAHNAHNTHNAHNAHIANNAHNADDLCDPLCEDMVQKPAEDTVLVSVEGKAEKHLAKDFAAQEPASSLSLIHI